MTATTKDAPSPLPVTPEPARPAILEIVAPLDIDKLAEAFKKFEDFKRRLLAETDSVNIQGKQFIKKSGWRKWALACGVSDKIVSIERVPPTGRDPEFGFYYRIITDAFHQSTGRSASGVAVASSTEKSKWAHEEHDVFSLAATRSKNRAIADLVGGGEVSAEEIEADPTPVQQSQPKRLAQSSPALAKQTSTQQSWKDTTGS
jgi:hypothetical protein